MNMDGGWYSSAVKNPVMIHGTVDQGGSTVELRRNWKGLQNSRHNLQAQSWWAIVVQVEWLCCLGYNFWAGEVIAYHAVFPEQSDMPTRCVVMCF
jgi:hypothetical protein